MNPFDVPMAPPPLNADGEPMPCPRCGLIFERALPGLFGHPVGDPRLCPPPLVPLHMDARERKARRRGR